MTILGLISMMKIYIKNQQKAKKLNLLKIKRDLGKVLLLLRLKKAELSVVFVGSRKMKLLNSRYRGLRKVTDVLSFPLADENLPSAFDVLGDIVICIPEALSQAKHFQVTFYNELLRLLVHGLLHLIGYDHEADTIERRRMERKGMGCLYD